MTFDYLLHLLNRQLIEIHKSPLNAVESLLLKGIMENLSYSEIGQKENYSTAYLTNVAAPKLYKKLSQLFGKNVTKKNCRILIESNTRGKFNILPTYPSGAVPLNSPFYIERSPIEEQVYEEITKPGALIRIKAPKEMGKTSLLLRVLNHAVEVGYQTVTINLEQIDRAILGDLDRFLRFLCATASQHQLDWQSLEEVEQLIDLVGGHPALIHIALYHLSRQDITLRQLLQTASTPEGIFHRHLRRQWLTLQQEPELAEFFNLLLQSDRPIQLKPVVAYKLSSMGLIKQVGHEAIVSCQLYQDYFIQNFTEIDYQTRL